MPCRYIRSDYLDSDTVAKANDAGEVMWLRLMLVADDFGRTDGRLPVISRKCWPLGLDKDPDHEEIERRLQQLEEVGLIVRYEVDGKPYIYLPKFGQRTRAQKSKYPAPPPPALTGARQVTVKRPTDAGQVTDARPADDRLERERVRERIREQPPVDKKALPVDNPAKPPTARKPASETPSASPSGSATKAAPAAPPPDWEDSTDGIDRAGHALGMKRLPFETDDQLTDRIHARLALG